MARQAAELRGRSAAEAGVGDMEGVCLNILSDEQKIIHARTTNRIYANQILHSHVLLVTVVLITLSGIVLATLQLWASYKLALAQSGSLVEGGGVTLEPGRIAVKSSVVGVAILAISLAFFGLFVTKVYPIQQAILGPGAPTSGAAGDAGSENGAADSGGNDLLAGEDPGLVGPEAK